MAWTEQLLMCQRKGWYHLPSREAILGPKLVNCSCSLQHALSEEGVWASASGDLG